MTDPRLPLLRRLAAERKALAETHRELARYSGPETRFAHQSAADDLDAAAATAQRVAQAIEAAVQETSP